MAMHQPGGRKQNILEEDQTTQNISLQASEHEVIMSQGHPKTNKHRWLSAGVTTILHGLSHVH